MSNNSFAGISLTINDDNPPHQPASTAKAAPTDAAPAANTVCSSHFSSARNDRLALSSSFCIA